MRIDFEYGTGVMGAELPDELTDVFIPGKTVPDPPYIPEDLVEDKTRESVRNPIGMEPLSRLAHKGYPSDLFQRPSPQDKRFRDEGNPGTGTVW